MPIMTSNVPTDVRADIEERRQIPQDKPLLLSARALCHSYETRRGKLRALRGLDLHLQAGEISCLLGASGSGKSTALRVLAGLEQPETGEIIFNGKVLCDNKTFIRPEKRRMGLVFQDFALFPHLTVGDNIAYGLPGSASLRVGELLEAMELQGYEDKYPHQLSGGEAQRVALARALAPEPLLILMDEPFSGLDAKLKESVRDWILHILKSRNIGAVIVTHDSEEALYMADKITVIDKGHVLQSGTPDELYLRPESSFVAEFFGQVNKIHRRVAEGHIDTPFGRFACSQVQDGDCANLLFRPEHLHLSEYTQADAAQDPLLRGFDAATDMPTNMPANMPDGVALARVEAARMLGRSSLVHLQVWHEGDYSLHMHARVPGCYTPPEGLLMRLTLDKQAAFVFHENC